MRKGKELEEIQIKFTLTELKPVHANWLIECYNRLTSPECRHVIMAGWKESGIVDALSDGIEKLEALMDPFYEIDPFAQRSSVDFVADEITPVSGEFVTEHRHETGESDSDSDLELL